MATEPVHRFGVIPGYSELVEGLNGRQVTTADRCDSACDRCRCGKCLGAKSDACSFGNAGRDAGYIQRGPIGFQAGGQSRAGDSADDGGTLRPGVTARLDVAVRADSATLPSRLAARGPETASTAGQ